jgi:BirA family transcriptional regulator, biotin operon repressor / biotin---[acetyl-CoA-carboxylase] ligase
LDKITPNTLFTGQQIIYLPQCNSTNTFAQELLIKNKATEGLVVITDEQTQGHGQRGTNWEAEPGKNITLSLILKPCFLNPQQQFFLNICISLAVLGLVQKYLTPPQLLKVKWPNDIYYGNKKIGGILIQNSISGQFLQHSVIGIGLNINQISFAVPTASSFAQITRQTYYLPGLIKELLEQLEYRYLQLKRGELNEQKAAYLVNLYRFQEPHSFLINGQLKVGTIVGIDAIGRLNLEIAGSVESFGLKEIEFVV